MANLNLYKTFICVAEEKNLTKASEKMYVSQPAISNAIKELEAELGFELFLRKNKGVELTSYGERLYEKCKPAIEKLNDVEEYFFNLNKNNAGLIKIGVNTSNLNQLFYDSMTKLLEIYPDAEISILRYAENELYEGLDSGKLDYIVVDSEYSKDNLECITEFNIEYQIIGDINYFKKYQNNPLTIQQFAQEKLILANKSYTSRNNIDEFFKKNYLSLTPFIELDGYGYISNFVQNGYGISIVNPYFFRNLIHDKKLYIINKDFNFPKRKIILAKLKNSNNSKFLLEYEQIIRQIVEQDREQ